MTRDQAQRFLRSLGVGQTHDKGDWLTGSCPLAPWTHRSGRDRLPSFGLRVSLEQRASFHCFACRSGVAEELLHTLEHYAGPAAPGFDFKLAHQILAEEELAIATLPPFEEFSQQGQVFVAWPDWWLQSFVPVHSVSQAMDYLEGRGVSPECSRAFDLRWDSGREMVVAPFSGARGRAVKADVLLKHYDYSWQGENNAKLVWYNEQALQLSGPVVVVEGQFDAIRVSMGWAKVVANLTAKPTAEKMRKLADAGPVVQIPDNDEAGEESVLNYQRLAQKLGISLTVLRLPSGVKDPAECHPDFLRDLLHAHLGPH